MGEPLDYQTPTETRLPTAPQRTAHSLRFLAFAIVLLAGAVLAGAADIAGAVRATVVDDGLKVGGELLMLVSAVFIIAGFIKSLW